MWGEGCYVLYSILDLVLFMNFLREGICVLEVWIFYEKELFVLIFGNGCGEFVIFLVVEIIKKECKLYEMIVLVWIDDEVSGEL